MDQALSNLRVPRAACRLMRFYASRSEGFRPSLKMIKDETGVNEKYVSEVRQILVNMGLIGYDGRNVWIDWVRLQGFASIDPRMMGAKKLWRIMPISCELLGDTKKPVHTYIGKSDQYLYNLYQSTQEAVANGVDFPELRGTEAESLLGDTKKPVHTYIGSNDLVFGPNGWQQMGWYNPFDEPIPAWAADIPALPF